MSAKPLAVVIDDYALSSLPGLDVDLSRAGVRVMRCFRELPAPHFLQRLPQHRGAAVVGAPAWRDLRSRLEIATSVLGAPVIGVLPAGVPASDDLRGPGVVDLIPAATRGAAERVILMAQVPVVRPAGAACWPLAPLAPVLSARPAPAAQQPLPPDSVPPLPPGSPPHLVAIASSTGGVWVVSELLVALRSVETIAVAIAQHMDAAFVPFFAEWLASVSGWRTTVVSEPVPLVQQVVYLAQGGYDLCLEPGRVVSAPASSRYVPSADRLLRTAARSQGSRCCGVVLSGMGSDGADGLAELARAGGRAVVQDPAASVVPSMPESALRRVSGALVAAPAALPRTVLCGLQHSARASAGNVLGDRQRG